MTAMVFALHSHRHHASAVGELTVALAAAVSWVGVTGPGEAVLIGAGIAALRHSAP
jgi:hypothetical protein